VFTRYVSAFSITFITKLEIHLEKEKKKNQHVNTSICPSIYCDNVHVGFVFLVYLCKMSNLILLNIRS
jgi:hypothetical protein